MINPKKPISIIEKVQTQLAQKGYVTRTNEARNWLKTLVISSLQRASVTKLVREKKYESIQPNRCIMGRMYFYLYDPKGAKDMSYYDTFPLAVPFKRYTDGFLGLNLHYLPPNIRVKFLDKLCRFASDNKMDEKTKLRFTYDILNAAASLRLFKPCLKRYLFNQFQSLAIPIPPEQWDICCYMPLEQFQKASKKQVFQESIEKAKN
jgi:hypothetical protein